MVDLTQKFDVLVIGGGNAALCAAISARRAGASVLVLEGAPKFYRGGNTRHTRNMRCAHDSATEILTGPYTEEEFWDDLLRITGGQTDEELAKFMIRESKDILGWIVEQAGGAATNGHERILDLTPGALHQRVPFIAGSRNEVEYVVRLHNEPHGAGERSPLFGRRGLFRT